MPPVRWRTRKALLLGRRDLVRGQSAKSLITCLLALLAGVSPLRAQDDRALAKTGFQGVAEELPGLKLVTPGTRVDDGPPPGWTHLILKSVPRIATGDVDSLPESGRVTAAMFRNIVLADVRRSKRPEGGFYLHRMGLGVCVPDRGHDVVVTTESLDKLGIELGTIPRLILGRNESALGQGQLVARTSTFALFRSPVLMVVGGTHRRELLNYALCVDPKTGVLRTGLWWIDEEPANRQAAQQLELLAPSPLIFPCDLDVVARRLFGEIPVSWSIAMRTLPPGKVVPMPESLQRWSITDPTTFEQAAAMEREVRKVVR
jgi:hypothetical protein